MNISSSVNIGTKHAFGIVACWNSGMKEFFAFTIFDFGFKEFNQSKLQISIFNVATLSAWKTATKRTIIPRSCRKSDTLN